MSTLTSSKGSARWSSYLGLVQAGTCGSGLVGARSDGHSALNLPETCSCWLADGLVGVGSVGHEQSRWLLGLAGNWELPSGDGVSLSGNELLAVGVPPFQLRVWIRSVF